MTPSSDDDLLRAVFVTLEPPPGGLTRLRARRVRARVWPWALVGVVATAAALVLALRVTPPPVRVAEELVVGAARLDPAWVALGKVAAPSEPLTLHMDGALAARRIETGDESVVFYMLEVK